jgi:hypothetical protein
MVHFCAVCGCLPWFQRFIFHLPFAMKIIKINLWNQGSGCCTRTDIVRERLKDTLRICDGSIDLS